MGYPEALPLNMAVIHDPLLRHAIAPDDPLTQALAAGIAMARSSSRMVGRASMGLDVAEYTALLDQFFPGARPFFLSGLQPVTVLRVSTADPADEFIDLLNLLLRHGENQASDTRWLAHAVAACCLGDDHLWQDLGLKDRGVLSTLLSSHFPALHAANDKGMRWKKFLYKCLCERSRTFVCRSPSCQACSEYSNCFGPEEEGAWG